MPVKFHSRSTHGPSGMHERHISQRRMHMRQLCSQHRVVLPQPDVLADGCFEPFDGAGGRFGVFLLLVAGTVGALTAPV